MFIYPFTVPTYAVSNLSYTLLYTPHLILITGLFVCYIIDLLSEALCVQSGSTRALAVGATAADKRKWLIQLQRWMLAIMEVGTEKVEVTSHMLDTVEGYSQQLSLAEKEMVSCRTREELTGGGSSRSNSNATFNSHTHKSVQHSLPGACCCTASFAIYLVCLFLFFPVLQLF